MTSHRLPVGLVVVLLSSATAGLTRQSSEIVGRKPLYSNVDSQLSQLIERARLASPDEERELARLAPVSVADRVLVTIRTLNQTSEVLSFLRSLGATPVNVESEVIEAEVRLADLPSLSDQPQVARIEPIRRGMGRSVVSEGVRVHNALSAQRRGLTGQGVKVGIIDVGFEGLRQLMGRELPSTITGRCFRSVGRASNRLSDCERDTRHGTAVAETLIDMAPDVTLYIANPFSRLDLRRAMRWMVNQGVRVINHSVGWVYDGPGDGRSFRSDSPLRTVDLAAASGVLWVNAAGNEARSTWTGPFRDRDSDRKLEFRGRERNQLQLQRRETVVLQLRWDDVWRRSATDLDLFLEDSSGRIVAASDDVQDGSPGSDPLEILHFTAGVSGRYSVLVEYFAGRSPRSVQVQAFTGQKLSVFTKNGSLGNPADSANPGLLAIGATSWRTPARLEFFSSRGPTRDGRVKPDLVGADRGVTSSLGRFFGTSQATSHVAGLAALFLQRRPALDPVSLASELKREARARGAQPNNDWGYGLAFLRGPAITANSYASPRGQ